MSCNSKKIFFHVYIVFNRLVEPVAEWTVKVPIHSKLNMFFHKPNVSAFRPHGIQVNRNTARRRGQPRHGSGGGTSPFYCFPGILYLPTNKHTCIIYDLRPTNKGSVRCQRYVK